MIVKETSEITISGNNSPHVLTLQPGDQIEQENDGWWIFLKEDRELKHIPSTARAKRNEGVDGSHHQPVKLQAGKRIFITPSRELSISDGKVVQSYD